MLCDLGVSALLIQLRKADNSNLARMMYTFIIKSAAPQVSVSKSISGARPVSRFAYQIIFLPI